MKMKSCPKQRVKTVVFLDENFHPRKFRVDSLSCHVNTNFRVQVPPPRSLLDRGCYNLLSVKYADENM